MSIEATLQKTLALFDAPGEDERDVTWFVTFLAGRGWTTADQVCLHVGKEPTEDAKRWIRGLADRSSGRVIGFSKGYRLTTALTPEEYEHWRNTTLKSANSVRQRVLRTDMVFGFHGKDE